MRDDGRPFAPFSSFIIHNSALPFAGLRAVLRDPLYRWEVRRYWTGRRRALTAIGLTIWGAAWCWWFFSGYFVRHSMFSMCLLLLAWRPPLEFLAAAGAALSIAPEKHLPQFEHFRLTTLDPRRFFMARYWGRLQGLGLYWRVLGLLLLALVIAGRINLGWSNDPDSLILSRSVAFLAVAAFHAELWVMLLTDAAVGLFFSATSRSASAALASTGLFSFAVIPTAMLAVGAAGAAAAGWVAEEYHDTTLEATEYVRFLFFALARLAAGFLAMKFVVRYARLVVERAFCGEEAA